MSVIVKKTTTLRWGAVLGSFFALSLAVTAIHRANTHDARQGAKAPANQAKTPKALTPNGLDFGFIENKGQWDDRASFYAGWKNLDVWVSKQGITYDFFRMGDITWRESRKGMAKPRSRSGHVVSLNFLGSSPSPVSSGLGEREGYLNFIKGDNSVSNVKTYNEAWVNNLYPGVNMRVYRDNQSPRFDLIVAPGTSPSTIRFQYQGAHSTRIADNNTLLVKTRFGEVSVTDLYAYQQVAGQNQQVACKFVQRTDGTFGFEPGAYDQNKPLVIDPIVYSTLFGGYASGLIPGDDIAYDVVADQFNQAFVTGSTVAVNFPVTNGAYDISVSGFDAFITKFRADATNLIWATVIGGAGTEESLAIAVDRAGRACITGYTTSPDQPSSGAFPTTPNAFQTTYSQGGSDGFVARLSNTGGALDFGSYAGAFAPPLPPPPGDFGFDIGLDLDDNMFVVGQTEGADFPTTSNSLQPNYGGSTTDGFALKISTSGGLTYSTFVGGSAGESCNGVAVDDIGNAFIVGSTASANFPLVAGSFDTVVQGSDAFVGKLIPTGQSFDYCTVIGGAAGESGSGIALDQNGNAYICGSSGSVDFPRTAGSFDNIYDPPSENYVTKLAIDGRSLVYSTFMNGGGSQQAIGVDDLGVAHIVGINNIFAQPSIVTTAPPAGDDQSYNGPQNPFAIGDAYLQALDEAGTNIIYGSFIGGPNDEAGLGLYVDGSRNAYVVGLSNSEDGGFPTTNGVFKPTMFNDNFPNPPFFDGFLMKVKVRPTPLLNTIVITPGSVAGTEEAQMTINLTGVASPGGAVIRILSNNENVARPVDAGGNLLDQVVVPAGSNTFGPIRITTSDVVTPFAVTFSAELEGDTKTSNLTVAPWLTNLVISPNSVVGGNRVTGRVNLFRPAVAGMTVAVSSSDPLRAYAVNAAGLRINSFVVPTGDTTATFDVLTRGVNAPTNVTILVKISSPNLQVTRSQTLQIVPASLRSVSFAPNRVNGGEKSIGTILLDGEAGPTPIRVDLRQGSTGNPPVGVTFANGLNTFALFISQDPNDVNKGKSANFQVTAGVATGNTFRNVIAERLNTNPIQTRQGTLFVDQTAIASLDLEALSVVGGEVVTGHITLSQPAAPSGLRCKVRSSNVTYAPFGGTVTEIEVFVPAGAIRSNDFLITTKLHKGPGNQTSTISTFKQGYPDLSRTLTIRPVDLTFTTAQNSVIGGSQNFNCTLTLSEIAPTYGVNVALTSSDTTALTVPANIKILVGTNVATFQAISKSVTVAKSVTMTATVNTLPSALIKTKTVIVNPLGISLSLNPAVVTGGLSSTGTVTVAAPAGSSGLRVNLSSSNTAVAQVPSAIVLPTGATTGNFNIATFQVGADVSVTITARTPAGVAATATLRVVSLNIQVTVNPNSVVGGIQNTVGNTVISAPAPAGGSLITLTSSLPSAASVPATDRIPAGATQRLFVIRTSQVSTDRTVTITAKTSSGRSASTTMTVRALTIALSLSPSTVNGGPAFSTGLVTLGNNAPSGGMLVTLSSNSAAASVPSSVTVGQNTSTKTFSISTNPVAVDTNATITARLPAGRTATAVLRVLAARITLLTLSSFTVIGGDSTTGTVAINIPAPANGANISLTSGNAIVQVPPTVTITSGNTWRNFTITTTQTPVDVNVSVTATYGSSTRTVTLQVLAPTLTGLVVNPASVTGGQGSTGTVTIDRNAPAGGIVIQLSKDPAATGSPYVNLPASVTIPAGSRSASFAITTLQVSRTVATQISATFPQRTQVETAVLTLLPQ